MKSNEIEELVHLYEDGAFNRRELLKRVAGVTGSSATAAAALLSLGVVEKANAQQAGGCPENAPVPADVMDLQSNMVSYPGPAGTVFGYYSQPAGDSPVQLPAVVVIHENRGLTDHIKDVARRVARSGYVALAVDLLSRQGGTDKFPDPVDAMRAYGNVTAAAALEDMKASVDYLRTLGIVKADRVGCIGFCAGGTNSWNLTVAQQDLAAGVVYYGAPPAVDQLDNLQVPVLMHYAELDRNFTGMVPAALSGLVSKKKTFSLHVYEGVNHAFNNDTGANFNAAASCQAWKSTLDFWAKHFAS